MSKTSPTGGSKTSPTGPIRRTANMSGRSRCRSCPFFSGEIPEDVCARCSRSLGPRAIVAAGVLLLSYWVAGHTLEYFLGGTFSYWRPSHGLTLPGDYEFPVRLADYPLYGVALGVLYGVIATVPALAACAGGLWLGVALALVAGVAVPHPWFWVPLLGGAVLAGGTWGGPRRWVEDSAPRRARSSTRWWWRRLVLGVAAPLAGVLAVHVTSAVRTRLVVHLLPAGVAVAVSVALVALWWREVRWRSLRSGPIVWTTLLLVVAAPLVFSFTVTFPYHRYRILWGSGRQEAARFDDFARRYPGSPFAAEALYQEARLTNLSRSPAAGGALPVSEGPVLSDAEGRISAQALPVYDRLISAYPQSVAAARARLDRARWYLQNADFEEVRRRYRDILITYETHIPPGYRPPPGLMLAGVCRQAGSGRTFTAQEKQVAYYEAYLAASEALTFLSANSQFEAEPLRLFLRLDPPVGRRLRPPASEVFDPGADDYRRRLQELLLLYPEDVYPELGLFDDVRLRLARGLPDEADRLAGLLVRYHDGDARGRILYRLAELAFDRGALTDAGRYLRRLSVGSEGSPAGLEAEWARALLEQGLAGLARWPHPFPSVNP